MSDFHLRNERLEPTPLCSFEAYMQETHDSDSDIETEMKHTHSSWRLSRRRWPPLRRRCRRRSLSGHHTRLGTLPAIQREDCRPVCVLLLMIFTLSSVPWRD
jgi:hypothetical protein